MLFCLGVLRAKRQVAPLPVLDAQGLSFEGWTHGLHGSLHVTRTLHELLTIRYKLDGYPQTIALALTDPFFGEKCIIKKSQRSK